MAGEPILVVDDTPVNLKLTRILLVNEGYKVLTAASAEEALDLLRSYHPRLILADIQLPGIDGLEMTRRIKQDERTRNITVVALTAFAMKGDEQRALEAGCDGYITKPIDTRTLGFHIRELLERNARAPEAEQQPYPEHESVPAAEMEALRRRFLSEGQERARELLLDLDGAFNPADGARAVHQWIGTGGLLEFSALARLAREVETLLLERPVDTAQVRESLTNLMLAFSSPPEARDMPMPEAILESLSGKHIALVGLPAPETQRLCVALERVAAHPQFFELSSAPDPAQLRGCDLVVAWVQPQSANSAWLTPSSAAGPPTLFMGSHDDLLALAPQVQAMAAEFLMDGWQPDEALVRLSLALTHRMRPAATAAPASQGGPIPVLIGDADAAVRTLLQTTLQDFGMEVHHAADGRQALEIARRVKPRAAVLDVNMPGMESDHVLSTLRSEGPETAIVLVAARQQESDVIRGFTLGADTYVVKPFSPMELVARVRRLIAR